MKSVFAWFSAFVLFAASPSPTLAQEARAQRWTELRSEDGRYVVRYASARDALLVPYAMDTLRRADAEISRALGFRHPGPIRLDFFSSPRDLAQGTGLTEEDIERTGTVALCKWDRLLVSSPRSLSRGYAWLDTIAHELAHLVLTRATEDRAPVWVQEGIARYLERAWRGGTDGTFRLEGPSLAMLVHARDTNALLSFDRLHPSIALLPSQEDAALAFAEVSTFVESVVATHGTASLARVAAELGRGTDARVAFARATGSGDFAALEGAWRERLRRLARPANARWLPRRFVREGSETDDSATVENVAAKRALRLGDLLWDRGRQEAALVEYRRGSEISPDDPILASRFANAAIALGRPEITVAPLERVLHAYPEHAPALASLGHALVATGQTARALEILREAIRQNPFDATPHCDLAEHSPAEDERERERAQCHAHR